MKNSGNVTKKILWYMVLGVIVGIFLNRISDNVIVQKYLLGFIFKLGSKGFVALIKMVVVPLVFFSLIVGTSEMGDIAKLGRIGTKTLLFYLGTTAVALIIAVTFATFIQPGVGFDLSGYTDAVASFQAKEAPPIADVFLNIIPKNPVESLASGNMLQIIFFAMLLGGCMTVLGDKAAKTRQFFTEMNDIMIQMVWAVMKVAPWGVFFLSADTFTKLGFSAFVPLGKYMLTVLGALAIHAVVTYGSLLVGVGKLNPVQFIKNFLPALSVSFSTASSNATLPITLDTVTKRCGVDKEVSAFTIPLGATVNMDGSAITQGVATIFIAQAYGIPLGFSALMMVVVTATLSSVGTAGVPSASMIMLAMVLGQVGLPVEAIGIIIGVDRLLSMTRTMLNVSGDAICTMLIAKSEGQFDESVFNQENLIEEKAA